MVTNVREGDTECNMCKLHTRRSIDISTLCSTVSHETSQQKHLSVLTTMGVILTWTYAIFIQCCSRCKYVLEIDHMSGKVGTACSNHVSSLLVHLRNDTKMACRAMKWSEVMWHVSFFSQMKVKFLNQVSFSWISDMCFKYVYYSDNAIRTYS